MWGAGRKHEVLPVHSAHLACEEHVGSRVGIYSWQDTAQTADQNCPWAGPCSLPPSNPGMPQFPLEKSCCLMFYCLERMDIRLGHSWFFLFYCSSAFTLKLVCASFCCYTGSITIQIFPFLLCSYMSISTAYPCSKQSHLQQFAPSLLCPVRFCITPKMDILQTFWATARNWPFPQ